MFRNWIDYTCVAFLFLGTVALTEAQTLIVGKTGTPCPNAQYTTITAAICGIRGM